MPLLLLILLLICTPVWAVTRYVSTTGSDTNTCAASTIVSTPKRNLTGTNGAITCMSGGDTLLIRGGTYLEGIDNTFGGTGTVLPSGSSWGSPTTVAAYPGETVTLRPPGASYFRVIFMRSGEQYIVIDRLILDGSDISAQIVDIGYPDSTAPHHIRLSNVEVHGGANTEDRDGIHVGSGAHHFELLNSRIHHVGGAIEGTPQEHGLYLSAPDSLIDGNEIDNTSGYGLHMYLGASPVNARNIVRNNKAHHNAAAGLLIGSGSDVIAYNNVSYNNTYEGIVLGFNMTTAGVYNNVAYGNTGAGLSISASSTDVNARNNIIYGNGSQISDAGIGTVFDQNLCGSAGTGCEVIGDPGFVDAAGGDFHIASTGSPAVGAGINLSSAFTTDADGLTRPAIGAWTLGAYQFTAPPGGPTLYVSTGGSGDCSSGSPCSLDTARGQAAPGDVITLANGNYSAANITCGTNAVNGTSGAPITLKATNERLAHLSTDGSQVPLFIHNCAYWSFEGLQVSSSDYPDAPTGGEPVYALTSNHLIFRRLLIHHTNRYTNSHALILDGSTDNLVEESEAYYFHRDAFIAGSGSGGDRNIFRRNYANSRGWACGPPCYATGTSGRGQTANVFYPGSNNIVENSISEGNAGLLEIQADYGANSTNNRVFGSISLNDFGFGTMSGRSTLLADTLIRDSVSITSDSTGIYSRSARNTQIENVSILGGAVNGGIITDVQTPLLGGGPPYSVFVKNSLVTNAGANSYAHNITQQDSWGIDYPGTYQNVINFNSTANVTNTAKVDVDPQMGTCYAWIPDGTPMKGAGLGGADIGANILYRYQDGVISTTPLWDTTTGAFPCGATVAGLNDSAGNSCSNVHQRLNINQGGCSFPASYAVTAPDYRLQSISPLRNAALCLASVPLDIVGYTRGSACDMGAYEFQSGEAIGTVAKYLFSEGSGVTVADSSGRGHTGTFSPNAGWTTGRIGPYAGIFDGTRYVTIPGVAELRPTVHATLSGWFKATETSEAGGNIVDLPNGAMSLYLTTSGHLVCQAFDGTNYPSISSGATYFDDAWRFADCSYEQGDGLYLRVNHTQVGFVALSIVLNYMGYLGGGGTENVEIGRSSQASTLGFIGSIDQVTVKDTACDTACDLALFQEGMSQRRIMVMGVR